MMTNAHVGNVIRRSWEHITSLIQLSSLFIDDEEDDDGLKPEKSSVSSHAPKAKVPITEPSPNRGGVPQRTSIPIGPPYINRLFPRFPQPIPFHSTMKLSSALAEIVSEFSGFQHLHPKSTSSSSSESVPRHSLNITVGVQQVDTITRSSSSSSLNDFQCIQRKTSTASYLVIE